MIDLLSNEEVDWVLGQRNVDEFERKVIQTRMAKLLNDLPKKRDEMKKTKE